MPPLPPPPEALSGSVHHLEAVSQNPFPINDRAFHFSDAHGVSRLVLWPVFPLSPGILQCGLTQSCVSRHRAVTPARARFAVHSVQVPRGGRPAALGSWSQDGKGLRNQP